jgi:hypothetical protein
MELTGHSRQSQPLTTGRENEAESWLPVQQWALSLRRRGISVLLDHHAGRNGEQRETSKREDVLDTMLTLRHPADYLTSDFGICVRFPFS